MEYKVFTRADLHCPFMHTDSIPDRFKTEAASRRFCRTGCCPICAPLFWWVTVLKKTESQAPQVDLFKMITDPKMILLLPMRPEVSR